ncbi:MAG: hypothetical protein PWP70_1490 [Moorella sp. (in: firmicutes)]|nr:hypothetical protein [Moorella sp. (in: firmicutes)]
MHSLFLPPGKQGIRQRAIWFIYNQFDYQAGINANFFYSQSHLVQRPALSKRICRRILTLSPLKGIMVRVARHFASQSLLDDPLATGRPNFSTALIGMRSCRP